MITDLELKDGERRASATGCLPADPYGSVREGTLRGGEHSNLLWYRCCEDNRVWYGPVRPAVSVLGTDAQDVGSASQHVSLDMRVPQVC